jgi:transcriptional regulator with XRE-family HTH domain
MDSLGKQVRDARERYGYTQVELAFKAKVGIATIQGIESERRPVPGLRSIINIARELGATFKFQSGSEVIAVGPLKKNRGG